MGFRLFGPNHFYLIFSVSFALDENPRSAVEACSKVWSETVLYKKGSNELLRQDQILLEDKTVGPAVKKTLETYANAGIHPPDRRYFSSDESFTRNWENQERSAANRPHYSLPTGTPLTKFKSGTGPVYDVTLQGKRYAFREVGQYLDLRVSVAAAEANEFMGLGTVPAMRPAVVDQKVGFLANYVEGTKLPLEIRKKQVKNMIETGKLDPHSYSDAMGFEFLFSNTDATGQNTRVGPDGKVYCIDHNSAARSRIADFSISNAALGTTLPEKYTAEFIKTVKALSRGGTDPARREKFIKLLEKNLTADEVGGVLFRLDIIAEDLNIRGDNARFL